VEGGGFLVVLRRNAQGRLQRRPLFGLLHPVHLRRPARAAHYGAVRLRRRARNLLYTSPSLSLSCSGWGGKEAGTHTLALRVPLLSEFGTCETVKARLWPLLKARFWPVLSGESPQDLARFSLFARKRFQEGPIRVPGTLSLCLANMALIIHSRPDSGCALRLKTMFPSHGVGCESTLHPTPYIPRPTPYTLHPTTHTPHPTPYTLPPTLYVGCRV